MSLEIPAYGLWSLVVINSAVFIIFAFSFTRPRTARDWRSFGAFVAFLVALFTEMYGFPLTIYLLSGWLSSRYPGLDLFSHEAGHLWETLLGWRGDPHVNPVHLPACSGSDWVPCSPTPSSRMPRGFSWRGSSSTRGGWIRFTSAIHTWRDRTSRSRCCSSLSPRLPLT
jgi:hypothetical protein